MEPLKTNDVGAVLQIYTPMYGVSFCVFNMCVSLWCSRPRLPTVPMLACPLNSPMQ